MASPTLTVQEIGRPPPRNKIYHAVTSSKSLRFTLVIIAIFSVQLVACLSQTASNAEPMLAVMRSNNLALLNTNNPNYASNFAAAYAAYRQGKVSKGVLMILAQRAANAELQEFYGRVVDQYGLPISNIVVTGNLAVMGGLGDGAKNQTLTALSDANGFFQFTGLKGWQLGILVKKAGYAMNLRKGPIGKITCPNDRETFTMWKLQGAEPLVEINQRYKLHYTSAPINIDLLAGKIVPNGGDISITVNRPEGEVSERNPQDWSVQVGAMDGGLIESSVGESRITYAAPESGYQPSDTLVMSSTNHTWSGGPEQTFFVESRNGQVYSKITFGIAINRNPDGLMDITFDGTANPDGSRNWEATAPQQ